LTTPARRGLYALWLVLIGGFALLHALNLRADFPNHSPWFCDWAKYTDEGWYGNAAIRAHLSGNWYLRGDFNPAPAVPVWPFLEWVLFCFSGVTIQAARGLAAGCFAANLLLSYMLLRVRGPRWMALLALTLIVTSPFLYCFSRLAILEPSLTTLTLGALNLAVRLPRLRRPVWASACVGLLFTLMALTKTSAIFLLPALGWAMLLPLWQIGKQASGSPHRDPREALSASWGGGTGSPPWGGRPALRCASAAAAAFAFTYGLWMALVVHFGLWGDFKYFFMTTRYDKPPEFYWPLVGFWWSFHGGLWVDRILIPLAGLIVLGAVLARWSPGVPASAAADSSAEWNSWGRKLLRDPVFGASILAVAGYILFMTCRNHPQPRYFAVVAFFCFFVVAQGTGSLLGGAGWPRRLGWAVVALAAIAATANGIHTLTYAAYPEYTFDNAAQRLTRYIDTHPNGNRLLVSSSGDQISLFTRLPALCGEFGAPSSSFPGLPSELAFYRPGWYAVWNDMNPILIERIHTRFSLEQEASFPALDDPDRNLLVLFKLHPLPGGQVRDPRTLNLRAPLPGDRIDIPVD